MSQIPMNWDWERGISSFRITAVDGDGIAVAGGKGKLAKNELRLIAL